MSTKGFEYAVNAIGKEMHYTEYKCCSMLTNVTLMPNFVRCIYQRMIYAKLVISAALSQTYLPAIYISPEKGVVHSHASTL